MMAQRNSFINGIGFTEENLLIQLLNNDDTDDDNELHLIKHSTYYGENEFFKLLSSKVGISIISGNIQSIEFDECSPLVDIHTIPLAQFCYRNVELTQRLHQKTIVTFYKNQKYKLRDINHTLVTLKIQTLEVQHFMLKNVSHQIK